MSKSSAPAYGAILAENIVASVLPRSLSRMVSERFKAERRVSQWKALFRRSSRESVQERRGAF
jgi:hypothetical protein